MFKLFKTGLFVLLGYISIQTLVYAQTPIFSTKVNEALKAQLDYNGKWKAILFADGTSQTTAGAGGDVTGQASSIDNEISLFSGTTGKVIKRATTTGIVKAASGVISAVTTSLGLSGEISDETGSGALVFGTSPAFTTQITTPSIVSVGALGVTPASGSNLNVNLATTGDFAVNTSQFYVDTSAGNVGIGSIAPLQKAYIAGNTQTTGEFIEGTGSIVSTAAIIPYIQLSSTANQVPASTAEMLITYSHVDEQQTFNFVPTSGTVTIPESGVYFIIAGGQVGKASGVTTRLLDLWVKKNNVDVPRSSVRNSIKDANDTKVVIQNTGLRCVAGDTLKIYVAVDDITGSTGLYATTPAVGPVIPSIITTIYKISQ